MQLIYRIGLTTLSEWKLLFTHTPAVSYDTSVFYVQLRNNEDIELTTFLCARSSWKSLKVQDRKTKQKQNEGEQSNIIGRPKTTRSVSRGALCRFK